MRMEYWMRMEYSLLMELHQDEQDEEEDPMLLRMNLNWFETIEKKVEVK